MRLGLGAACNLGARRARGEYLVLLDQRAEVEPEWFHWLLHTADANPEAGAVGSCVLAPDGRLQEAGSLVWWDGRTTAVGQGIPGDALTWHFVRRIDFASGSSLLIRRTVWDRVGGFDEAYTHGMWHCVDLCLQIRALGHHVLVEPRSRVRHVEAERSADDFESFVQERLRLALLARWKRELESHGPSSAAAVNQAIHRARGYPRRVLVVDDFIPDPAAGAGFGRMFDVVIVLAQAGYAVFHHPTRGASPPAGALVDSGMAIIEGDLSAHLQRPDTWYDVIVVSRPHNFDYVWPAARMHHPWASLIYDCEALWWRRLERQADLTPDPHEADRLRMDAARMQQVEVRNVRAADAVVTVSQEERAVVRDLGVPEGHLFALSPLERGVSATTRSFSARRDIGFVAGFGWRASPTERRWLALVPQPGLPGDPVACTVGLRLPRHRPQSAAGTAGILGSHGVVRRTRLGPGGLLR